MFELQPELSGQLIRMRPLKVSDYEALFAVASDPLIWEQHPSSDRYKPEVFKEFFRIAMESGGALVAIDNVTGEIIGSSRYHGYDETASEVEVGWTFLARKYWGGEYNREMKQLMLRHAFNYVKAVLLLIGPQNMRSRKAAEKIGAIFVGTVIRGGNESVVYRLEPGGLSSI